mgnify:CR=1 FL=1
MINCDCGELKEDCAFPECDTGDKEKKCQKMNRVLPLTHSAQTRQR